MESCDEGDADFDWDAALKEIDVVCQTVASPCNQDDFGCPIPCETAVDPRDHKNFCGPKKLVGVSRQSTLDKFVGTSRRFGDGNQESCLKNEYGSSEMHGNLQYDEEDYAEIEMQAANTWIYPVNIPLRDYQLSIARTAIFSNTLVALPTGLGKTLIAAVVMYNYFRWFPKGNIIFAAPSRPLVMQQIEACHNIVGIPQEWAIDMTGQMSPSERSCFWKSKRVFFVTPQVLEKDIQSGTCLVKNLVCLVIDEAHRAQGNYSYCVAVRKLMAIPVQFRILALTATPGSKQQSIQNVIDNLHISTLEFRNESHQEVRKYVHNRKLELVKVTMGNDAIEINNLLLETIQPFVDRLRAVGVLYYRDISTLSPCSLLMSRDKFRQEPPLNLPHTKYGEVEGYFGVLITLYHIRKLLSSHGIRPAYEMLEEKLQQGSVARLLRSKETIFKAKLLMQQSLSHGAPNPKLLRMTEILIDHFKNKDPKHSRVIVFSNFRGSVTDIMDSLSSIGELVKATQFIGQSSGKSSKGQNQKVQQAVLEKFRAGGYNVLVATSIGEEGLDIMEVDLVICFDANISPLRMIQRMGRTGRKHDGRVVVLACEGSELKGYLKKQENGKTIMKHMHNGGTNSFNFHSSPRMVPHICKPEVQFVEFSIQEYIPRGKKTTPKPIISNKMPDSMTNLLAKYYESSSGDNWRPSLIAFPHFQAFPSRVHKVRHSLRTTGFLIDAMQRLQELSSLQKKENFEVKAFQYLEATAISQDDNSNKGSVVHDTPKAFSPTKMPDVAASFREMSRSKYENCLLDLPSQNPPIHLFLFGADFVSVNSYGRVLIASVPSFPLSKEARTCKSIAINTAELSEGLKSTENVVLTDSTETGGIKAHLSASLLPNSDAHEDQTAHVCEEIVFQTPISKGKLMNSEDSDAETHISDVEMKTPVSLARKSIGTLSDMELSPRLTNFIEKGVVPESPIIDIRHSVKIENVVAASFISKNDTCELLPKFPSTNVGKNSLKELSFSQGKNESLGPNNFLQKNKDELRVRAAENDLQGGLISGSPINEENHNLVDDRVKNSSCEDWQLSSAEASRSIQKPCKFKRLRKKGDVGEGPPSKVLKEDFSNPRANRCRSFTEPKSNPMKYITGKQKTEAHAKDFIEDEAEVSSDAEVSEDEEDRDNDNYEDSFIDDGTNAATESTQAEINMMAVYRRSLLTPFMESQLNTSPKFSHEGSLRTPQSGSCSENQSAARNSIPCQSDLERISWIAVASETSGSQEDESKIENRKRKLSFHQVSSIAATSRQSEATGKAPLQCQSEQNDLNADLFYDDQFYVSLDLDAMEAQATKLLSSKLAKGTTEKEIPNPLKDVVGDLGLDSLDLPTFDLGI